jgi:chemotaxis protein MotB
MTTSRAQPGRHGGEEDSYLASVSDLMVGLLFVFLIILMAFAMKFRTEEARLSVVGGLLDEERKRASSSAEAARAVELRLSAEIDSLEAERARLNALIGRERAEVEQMAEQLADRDAKRTGLLTQVHDLLARRNVAVSLVPENGVLRLPEELLFESGASELRDDGERALRQLAYALARVLPCYADAPDVARLDCPNASSPILEAVLVEGHTDRRPIATGDIADNWALASLRGINTFKALVRYEPSLELLRNVNGEPLLGVSAYEARRPVVAEDSAEAHRLNRRIDLRFVVAAPSNRELARVRERLGERPP